MGQYTMNPSSNAFVPFLEQDKGLHQSSAAREKNRDLGCTGVATSAEGCHFVECMDGELRCAAGAP